MKKILSVTGIIALATIVTFNAYAAIPETDSTDRTAINVMEAHSGGNRGGHSGGNRGSHSGGNRGGHQGSNGSGHQGGRY